MADKAFVYDESKLTPDDFRRYPVWMNAHNFHPENVERKYGPFARRPDECARLAHRGPLPYPLLDEDEDHTSAVIVRCVATTAAGDAYDGFLTPLTDGEDLPSLSPTIFTPTGQKFLCGGEYDAAQRATILPRWRADIEAAFGRPLREIFPVTLVVPAGILPPDLPARWSLPGLMYWADWKPQVMPVD